MRAGRDTYALFLLGEANQRHLGVVVRDPDQVDQPGLRQRADEFDAHPFHGVIDQLRVGYRDRHCITPPKVREDSRPYPDPPNFRCRDVPKIVPGLLVTAIGLVVVACGSQPVAPGPAATKPVTAVPTFAGALLLTRLRMISPQTGWAVAAPGGKGLGHLVRTSDGGAHWQAIKPPSEVRGDPAVFAGLPEACPMGGPIGQPVFTDPQTGWLGAFCQQPFFYVTHDGGHGWSRQNVPAFPGSPPSSAELPYLQYYVDSLQRLSPTDVVVFFHRGVTTGANALQAAAIYLTHDGGNSWP